MNGGFRFCGTDISVLGLEYVPDMKDTYVYAGTQTQVSQEVFEGHDGGYYYGMTKQPKEFPKQGNYQRDNRSNRRLFSSRQDRSACI